MKKKQILVTLLAIIMVFSLSACGGDKKEDTANDSGSSSSEQSEEFIPQNFSLNFEEGIDQPMTEKQLSQAHLQAFYDDIPIDSLTGASYEEVAIVLGGDANKFSVLSEGKSRVYYWIPEDDGDMELLSISFKEDDTGAWIFGVVGKE